MLKTSDSAVSLDRGLSAAQALATEALAMPNL